MVYNATIEKYNKALTAAQKKRLKKQYEDLMRSYADETRAADVDRVKGIAAGRNQLANIGLSGNVRGIHSGEVNRLKKGYNASMDATTKQIKSVVAGQNDYLGAQLYNQTIAARNAATQQTQQTQNGLSKEELIASGVPTYKPTDNYTEEQYYDNWRQGLIRKGSKELENMKNRAAQEAARLELEKRGMSKGQYLDEQRKVYDAVSGDISPEMRKKGTALRPYVNYLVDSGYSKRDATEIALLMTTWNSRTPGSPDYMQIADQFGLTAEEANKMYDGTRPPSAQQLVAQKIATPEGRESYVALRTNGAMFANYGVRIKGEIQQRINQLGTLEQSINEARLRLCQSKGWKCGYHKDQLGNYSVVIFESLTPDEAGEVTNAENAAANDYGRNYAYWQQALDTWDETLEMYKTAFLLSVDEAEAGKGIPNYGDADGDGEITAADAAKVLRSIVHLEGALTLQQGDANNDGAITASDVAYVLRCVVKLEKPKPIK